MGCKSLFTDAYAASNLVESWTGKVLAKLSTAGSFLLFLFLLLLLSDCFYSRPLLGCDCSPLSTTVFAASHFSGVNEAP